VVAGNRDIGGGAMNLARRGGHPVPAPSDFLLDRDTGRWYTLLRLERVRLARRSLKKRM
jgi:hypothetical protein